MRTNLAICAVLALATIAVYLPVRDHEFLNYDDQDIFANPHVAGGFTWENVAWAFTSTDHANWFPLTRLTHMLDWRLFGKWAGGHHLVNVGLHAACGILLMLVLSWMTGRRWPSAAVAALFLVHPLHVESVAWAIERKDTLSGLFWMLTMAAYVWYVHRPGIRRYGPVFLSLALGLMSKPMLVTLPLALLLLDWWPLGRFRRGPAPAVQGQALRQNSGTEARRSRKPACLRASVPSCPTFPLARLVAEKVPLLALAAASSIVTYVVQSGGGAITGGEHLRFAERLANALVACAAYLAKTVVPVNLAIFYPLDRHMPMGEIVGAGAILAALTISAALLRRRLPYAAVGWFWFAGALVPVIGLVQVGGQSMADRYTYLPLVGVFIALAWGAADLAARWRLPQSVPAAAGAASIAACIALTAVQLRYWADSEKVFQHAVDVTRENWRAQDNLGLALAEKGRKDLAIVHYREAVRIKPLFAEAHNHLAAALVALGRTDGIDEAVRSCDAALRIDPNDADAHVNMGGALAARGQPADAIKHYRDAIRANPACAEAYTNCGIALAAQGSFDQAMECYRKAILIKPDAHEIHNNLAVALASTGKTDEAVREYREAIRIKQDYAEAHANLGAALAALNRPDEAIAEYLDAIRINKDFAEAHNNLAVTLAARGRIDEAIGHYREAIRINPNYEQARRNLAAALAKRSQSTPAPAVNPSPAARP